ncbi:phosphoadenosine phosphosulfate reductase family protein [Adlercreutzia sp. ZJ138]|uniref:phosphoadenosine phosphosulfate reductase domain-containing protein n=1 Tax=Adlercreutzia sp. ZJ138 TaxID=2709405 RepID=UPI00197E0576|nr:phosphoadenosine phosphosulfate reductase family protein [Adlercreutzia sp. ZJ138]
MRESVWAIGSKYYVNGEPHNITIAEIQSFDPVEVREKLDRYAEGNDDTDFRHYVKAFVKANRAHKNEIVHEACEFIVEASKGYPDENLVVSFSGGKDSTVTADLAVRALSNPYLVHIFGDTTLEFPSTIEYAERFRSSHPLAVFKTTKNYEQSFYDVAEEIGPPARMMRWCCSMFKTGPISRAFKGLFGDQPILTFYGIRKGESVSRSKYNRIEDSAESVKIQRQKVAAPIFYWNDIDVWLYILAEGVDFNDAYRLGYERVGCWCCPNNNPRAQFLSQIYMPEESEKWHTFLVDFARRIGKPDPEVYVDTGKWKARQGGNGVTAASSVQVDASHCATEDNAMIFSLERPFSEELVGLFTPIGDYAPDLGRKLLDERLFVDPRTSEPVIAVMPFIQPGYEHAVKVRILRDSDSETLLRQAKYQVVKYNACRQCLKCESLCRFGAITITGDGYRIDPAKCAHCKQCVTDKYLEGGCLMRKYLKTKDE